MLDYKPGSMELQKLQQAIEHLKANPIDVPVVIGGQEYRHGEAKRRTSPADHKRLVATYYEADAQMTQKAIENSLEAKKHWENLSFEARAAIFLKAADLCSTKYRYELNAATMLGQGKSIWQAEIDSAAEQCDFYRFNVKFASEIYDVQPPENTRTTWNRMEYRPLEGFVLAITPFNFAAIGSNLPTAPALMGNVALWKPSSTAIAANYLTLKILREAGLPDGVINFLPSDAGVDISNAAFAHSEFAGLHFTGSTPTFKALWRGITNNLDHYRTYPRIVGETGGKNFHFVHNSADPVLVVNQTVRGAFEYSGQKCSATSRAYFPDNLWPQIRDGLIAETQQVINNHFGQPDDPNTFVSAVIDGKAYGRLSGALERIQGDKDLKIIVGGGHSGREGWFVTPTIVQTTNPNSWLMKEELFGPIICVYVYPEAEYERTLEICDRTATYGLTGSIFARERYALEIANQKLRNSAGNFYINDKSTGAIVGQQPFGGARASGTNDKAGSHLNLLRWVSARTIKETFVPISHWSYPHMKAKPSA